MSLRVLALVTDAYGGYGGIARFNRDLVEALAAHPGIAGVDVLPRLATDEPEEPCDGVSQHPPCINKWAYALKSLAASLSNPPHVVVNGHLYHGGLARSLAAWTGARMLSVLHGSEVWTPIAPQLRAALQASDLVASVSHDTQARYLAQMPAACAARAEVLHNTVDPVFCPADRGRARGRWGLGDEFAILTVARLDGRGGYKGHDRIIAELETLDAAAGRPVVYLIAGDGPDRHRLEKLCAASGVRHKVRFLGRVAQEALPDLYRAADLFALPSTGEGFGIVFVEAMACGTPAIGLDVGGAREALGDGELGSCVAPEAFSDALRAVIARPRPRPEALHKAVTARFGRARFYTQVHALVDRLTGAGAGQDYRVA